MSFPLPRDPTFIKEIVEAWLDDVDDRLEINQASDAEASWRTARTLYLGLPPGHGDEEIEKRIFAYRVKLDNISYLTNENNL